MSNKIESIQVLGTGCTNCKKFYELTKQAVSDLDMEVEVEYSTDIQKIIELGVMSSPVLAIDSKAVIVGQVPSLDKIKEVLSNGNNETAKESCGCSCGGKC